MVARKVCLSRDVRFFPAFASIEKSNRTACGLADVLISLWNFSSADPPSSLRPWVTHRGFSIGLSIPLTSAKSHPRRLPCTFTRPHLRLREGIVTAAIEPPWKGDRS